jgi:transcriptional regulator with XRE-family HTH domain
MVLNEDKIKEIMKSRNLTRKDLIKKIRVSPQLMSYYFKPPVTIHKAERIAASLSTSKDKVSGKDLLN